MNPVNKREGIRDPASAVGCVIGMVIGTRTHQYENPGALFECMRPTEGGCRPPSLLPADACGVAISAVRNGNLPAVGKAQSRCKEPCGSTLCLGCEWLAA